MLKKKLNIDERSQTVPFLYRRLQYYYYVSRYIVHTLILVYIYSIAKIKILRYHDLSFITLRRTRAYSQNIGKISFLPSKVVKKRMHS